MRKLVARSMVVAIGVLLVCGCSSTGSKSSSLASLNPMKYFAKSKPVPKPSQMTPNPSLPSADGLALSDSGTDGGLAPPSPYRSPASSPKQPNDSFAGQSLGALDSSRKPYTPKTDASLASSPQQGLYDPNGYAGGGTSSGYSLPKSNSLTSTPPSDSSSGYSLGGGRYDIQNGGLAATVPSGTSPTYGYAGASQTSAGAYPSNPYYSTSGADYNQTASYQTPPLTPQTSGGNTPSPYGAYGNSGADLSTGTYQADPNAAYGSSWNYAANSSSSGSYGGSTLANPTDRRDMGGIASLPSSPMTSPALGNTGSTATQYNYQDYQPGVTGYQPPNVPAYTPPIGYVQPSSSSSSAPSANSGYSPGTTSRYPSSTVQPATAAGSLPYSSSPSPYPSTTYGSSSALY